MKGKKKSKTKIVWSVTFLSSVEKLSSLGPSPKFSYASSITSSAPGRKTWEQNSVRKYTGYTRIYFPTFVLQRLYLNVFILNGQLLQIGVVLPERLYTEKNGQTNINGRVYTTRNEWHLSLWGSLEIHSRSFKSMLLSLDLKVCF